jgi:hypothetical protein
MNQTIVLSVIITCAVVFYTYMFFQGKIMRHFNMVDSRILLGGGETYKRLNTLMAKGDVGLYSYSFMNDPNIVLSVEYANSTSETARGKFSAKNLDEAVNQAYEWSIARGFIKETE